MKIEEYAIYKGNKYQIYNGILDNKNAILLLSHNMVDLERGFKLSYSEEYMQRHHFFTCEKEVSKSEVTEAYRIKTHAIYKGVTLDIMEGGNRLILATPYRLPYTPTGKQLEIKNTLIKKGFYEGQGEKDGCWYNIEVDINDPDLELIEERMEIDINKL